MSILNEPRKPDCDVCEWATAYHYAHGLNLCTSDLELVNKVAQAERERIIKLINDIAAPYGEDAQISVAFLIALIKGENK